MAEEAWTTDGDLVTAARRFAEELSGYELPVAYGVARMDGTELEYGHVNSPGGQHRQRVPDADRLNSRLNRPDA